MKKLSFVSIAFTALIAGSATAADLAPVYKTRLAAPPPQDWSGLYVGLEAGYGWGRQSTDAVDPGLVFPGAFTSTAPVPGSVILPLFPPQSFPDLAVPSTKQNGGLFGGLFGAQKQWGSWVLGIEGDIDAANMKGSDSSAGSRSTNPGGATFALLGTSTTVTIGCLGSCFTINHNFSIDSKIDMLASLRGKVGWSFAPNWLIYATGGAAFAHVENTVTSAQTGIANLPLTTFTIPINGIQNAFQFTAPNLGLSASGGTTMLGYALGGGVDWKLQLDAGSALVFGLVYVHYGFPEHTITLSNNAGGTFTFKSKESVDAIKGRISYLFSTH